MNNSINNTSVSFQATMHLNGIRKTKKLQNVIANVAEKTKKYPNDTIVISKNGFDVNYASAGIPRRYVKELLAMPEDKITKTILKLFNMHKKYERTEQKVANVVYSMFEKAGIEPSSKFDDEFFMVLDKVNKDEYIKSAKNNPILKHIYFDGVSL